MTTMYNLESPAYLEAKGLGKCWLAYADFGCRNDIMEIGFNENSGYVYIALENGITICSLLGRAVEYLVTNYDNGEEYFLDTYEEALQKDLELAMEFAKIPQDESNN